MTYKANVIIEKDENGYYAFCPDLEGCQTQGDTFEEVMANIQEAIELYLETLTDEERLIPFSRQLFTTTLELKVA